MKWCYAFICIFVSSWLAICLILYHFMLSKESSVNLQWREVEALNLRLLNLERHVRLKQQQDEFLLRRIKIALDPRLENISNESNIVVPKAKKLLSVIPILMLACDRHKALKRSLESLISHRVDPKQFPIIVSRDCANDDVKNVLIELGNQVRTIEQPDQSNIIVKTNEIVGYFKIARHYRFALNHVFNVLAYDQVVIVEDDLEFAPDFYNYFAATLDILKEDPTLWCVSAWNDNSRDQLVDKSETSRLYRSDFFGGLGWMLTRSLWQNELSSKWPRSYWDDWMRLPENRKGRACIRPELSRTKTFGQIGVSRGLFYDKYLKNMFLSTATVDFGVLDLNYLKKKQYDQIMARNIKDATLLNSIPNFLNPNSTKAFKITYSSAAELSKISKKLKFMDDSKAGIPRMAYMGVISIMFQGCRVYVVPTNWPREF